MMEETRVGASYWRQIVKNSTYTRDEPEPTTAMVNQLVRNVNIEALVC